MCLTPFSTVAAQDAVVVCEVDQEKILCGEVEREVSQSLADRKPPVEAREVLLAHALDVIIRRRLVLRYLERTKRKASRQDVDHRIEQIERHLSRRKKTIEEYLKETRQTREEFRFRIAWQLSWPKYLDIELSEGSIEKFFEKHRREFDGTKLRVAQILLRPANGDSESTYAELTKRATEIAAKVVAGQVTFAVAAQRHSMAPSADQGGRLGLISRHGPMPEPFSRAAFALQLNEISGPVRTQFGIHLIQCREIQPGVRTLDEVRDLVSQAAERYLFDWVVQRERPRANIVFTGAMSHVDPDSGEVVESREVPDN